MRAGGRIVLALAHSAAILGIDGYVLCVEADTPGFAIIGMPGRRNRDCS